MSPVLDVSIDTGANHFLDTFLAQGAMEGTVGYSGSRDNSIVIDYAVPVNKLALKYIGELVKDEGQSGDGTVHVGGLGLSLIYKCNCGRQSKNIG